MVGGVFGHDGAFAAEGVLGCIGRNGWAFITVASTLEEAGGLAEVEVGAESSCSPSHFACAKAGRSLGLYPQLGLRPVLSGGCRICRRGEVGLLHGWALNAETHDPRGRERTAIVEHQMEMLAFLNEAGGEDAPWDGSWAMVGVAGNADLAAAEALEVILAVAGFDFENRTRGETVAID